MDFFLLVVPIINLLRTLQKRTISVQRLASFCGTDRQRSSCYFYIRFISTCINIIILFSKTPWRLMSFWFALADVLTLPTLVWRNLALRETTEAVYQSTPGTCQISLHVRCFVNYLESAKFKYKKTYKILSNYATSSIGIRWLFQLSISVTYNFC